MSEQTRRTMYPLLRYEDPEKAIGWLEKAFGLTPHSVHRDDDGTIAHAEMIYDTGILMLGGADMEVGSIYIAVDDPDAHHDRAKAAGAEIIRELTDQPYGSRDYACRDLEGNTWYFGTYRP
ncbi:bleomycin resistance protein [Actinomadura craniellae]|uniref:Bleomycin resistance protein n=1 Tax=Actinomadura craniellae TaxID=2231787 RepID=A0A365HA98_9ACTN|nr:VOC family protein [Actinomadura craniellae]RAY16060.1 bleomycin resistance protein [Actinomadura craniellae]